MKVGMVAPVSGVAKPKLAKQVLLQDNSGWISINHKYKLKFSTPVNYEKVVGNVYIDTLVKATMVGLRKKIVPPIKTPGSMYGFFQDYEPQVRSNIIADFNKTKKIPLGEGIIMRVHSSKQGYGLLLSFKNTHTGEEFTDYIVWESLEKVMDITLLDIHSFYIRDNKVNEICFTFKVHEMFNSVVQVSLTVKP